MQKLGFIGWRGMVGSVLLDRMRRENDFRDIETVFFSTSQAGQPGPDAAGPSRPLLDAHDLDALARQDILLTCQGGDYTRKIHPALRARGWDGYWIDAASALRMEPNAVIILDPVNRPVIDRALDAGIRDFIGGNCTVSLMLLAVQGLLENDWVEWLSTMTYQSASGAGAAHVKELILQMARVSGEAANLAVDPAASALEAERLVTRQLRAGGLPTDRFGAPLAASLLPWIDRAVDGGQTREEWKGMAETNKILDRHPPVPVDGICVRVGSLRCHSQGLTIKLRRDIPLAEIEAALAAANDWVRVIPNEPEATLRELTPASISGQLDIPVGRIHKMKIGPEYLALFTVGDQLLWGAAEPLRRMLNIALDRA